MLIHEVEKILDKADYEYSEYSGCFDIIAKKQEILLLKVLGNVDSFQEEQADNLKTLSANLDASLAVIGLWTRREKLYDNIIYERFDIPAFTPRTLENMLVKEMNPFIYRHRGGLFSDIDPEMLRKRRLEKEMSQSEFAEKIGVTKKSVYEHESRKMKARREVARKMERLLGSVISGIDFTSFSFADVKKEPKTRFEKSISFELRRKGFGTNFVYQTPFNIIAKTYDKERFLVLSDAEEDTKRIEKNEASMIAFSEITEKPIVVVTKRMIDIELPVISVDELKEMTKRDVVKTAKKW